jgi:hypothetical protein
MTCIVSAVLLPTDPLDHGKQQPPSFLLPQRLVLKMSMVVVRYRQEGWHILLSSLDSLPGVPFIHAQFKLLAAKQAFPEFSILRLRAVGRKWRAS